MITAPRRGISIVKNGHAEPRLVGWMEAISRAVNQANHPGYSQIIEPSRGNATLSYTNGVLTQVSYADGSTKDFGYDNGVLASITDSAGTDLQFVFRNGELVEVQTS